MEKIIEKLLGKVLAEHLADAIVQAVKMLLADGDFMRSVAEAAQNAAPTKQDDKTEAVAEEEPTPKAEDKQPMSSAPTPQKESSTVPSLTWCWGGFNGSKAKEVADAQIASLKITSNGMSYKWVAGGCEKLGAASRTDYEHTLACLFLSDGRGGKFDFISTSRTTRDWKNVESGYNGWDAQAFRTSKKLYFCIVSKDGKRRTNIIEATR